MDEDLFATRHHGVACAPPRRRPRRLRPAAHQSTFNEPQFPQLIEERLAAQRSAAALLRTAAGDGGAARRRRTEELLA